MDDTTYYGFLGVAPQINLKTPYGGSVYEFLAISDESINNSLNMGYVETIASRERKGFFSGGLSVSGDFSFLIEPDNMDNVLFYSFGRQPTITPLVDDLGEPTGYYSKTFLPSSKELPPFTILLNRSGKLFTRVTGAKVDSLELSFSTGEAASASVSIIAADQESIDSTQLPSNVVFGSYMPFPYYNITLTEGEGGEPIANATGLTVTLENNLSGDNFVLGSKSTYSIGEGLLAVSGSMDLVFEDKKYFDRFMNEETFGIKIEAVSMEDQQMKLIIDLPKVVIETADVNMSGIETLTQTVAFTALKDSTAGYSIRATTINKKPEIISPA